MSGDPYELKPTADSNMAFAAAETDAVQAQTPVDPPAEEERSGLTRRTFVGASAAGAAAIGAITAGVPSMAIAKPSSPRSLSADVVVVGAGLAGMTCAHDLIEAGHSVVVLEARDRVGGRTFSTQMPGSEYFVERGGEALLQTDTQTALPALAKEVGIVPFRRHDTGNNILDRNGKQSKWDRNGPTLRFPPNGPMLADLGPADVELERMAATLPLDAPWNAPNAKQWDGESFESWTLQNVQLEDSRWLMSLVLQSYLAVEMRDVSLLYVLSAIQRFQVTPRTGHTKLMEMFDAYGDYRFPQGIQHVCIRLAERYGIGERVFLSNPVRRIDQTGSSVTVTTDNMTVNAQRVIVAMPPFVTSFIRYEPIVPPQRAQLLQRYPQGSLIKCHAFYERPFWRDKGLSGEALYDGGPVAFTGEGTPPAGHPGVMVGFIPATNARTWIQKPDSERKQAVLQNFARWYGPEALKPIEYFDMEWPSEQWTTGGFSGLTPPGVLTTYGEWIKKPFGRIHWSGTETASTWTGSLEGAVRAGHDTANEVLAYL